LAITNGIILPDRLQELLGVFQIEVSGGVKEKPLRKRVRTQVSAQCVISSNLDIDVSSLCKHDLVLWAWAYKDDGDEGFIAQWNAREALQKALKTGGIPGGLREAVNELFNERALGRPSLGKEKRAKKLEPISEVVQVDEDGKRLYDFLLWKEAIRAVIDAVGKEVFVALAKKGKPIPTFEEYKAEFSKNEVLSLYLIGAPKIAHEIVKRTLFPVWHTHTDALVCCDLKAKSPVDKSAILTLSSKKSEVWDHRALWQYTPNNSGGLSVIT
jgi:hypothetical protein